MASQTSLFSVILRIVASVLSLIAMAYFSFQAIGVWEIASGMEFPFWDYSEEAYLTLAVAGLAVGILWTTRAPGGSPAVFLWSVELIAYWIAFSISSYGFAKILKTQFRVPEHIKDVAMGDQHPFWLTWNYFGFSYGFSLIIAASQIGGSLLLLFPRTRLLGAVALLPVMINIVCVNIFYHINFGAFLNSVFFLAGLIFLLMLDFQKLKQCFLDFEHVLPGGYGGTKWANHLTRVFIILASFGLIGLYRSQSHTSPNYLRGVWEVEEISRPGEVRFPNKKDSLLTRLYFEHTNENSAILEFNGAANRTYNTYVIDTLRNYLTIDFGSDQMSVDVTRLDANNLQLTGLYAGDSVKLRIRKIRDTSW